MVQKGSTFHFSLPLQENLFFPDKTINISEEQTSAKSKETSTSGTLILVAEDDITNYRFLETLLKIRNLRCLHATDGEKVLEIIKNQPISLILMDIRMPNLDGLEATRELREQGYDIPIIAQTANAMSDDRQLALDAGCTDYMAKPIRKEQLFKLLEKYL
jgi:CheY-like chemotaxis protein